MIKGIKVSLLVVLFIGFIGHSQAESPVDVDPGQVEEVLNDGIDPGIPNQEEPTCQNGRCQLKINVLSVPLVQSKLQGLMEIGYKGGEDNSVAGSTALTYVAKGGKELSFGFTSEIDCEGEDKIAFRVGVMVGGTIKRYEVKGNKSKKLPPLCFPIPGATVVSLCLFLTKYKYHEEDKSMEVCLLLQLRVALLGAFGFKIANLHNRCMFLRREHFTRLNDKLKTMPSFAMRHASNLQQKLQRSFSLRRGNSIPADPAIGNELSPFDTPPVAYY